MHVDDSDEEFMVKSVMRAQILEVLEEQPQNSNELENRLDISRSTIHRSIQSLQDKGLIMKSNGKFTITGLGSTVTHQISTLRTQCTIAHRLEPFLNTIGPTEIEIPLEHFEDAEITCPEPKRIHDSAKRITDLIEASENLLMFSSVISPFYVDVAYQEIMDGMEIEVIFDYEVLETIAVDFFSEATEAIETGRFYVRACDEIPFELFIFDDRIGVAAHDENGLARAFIETDSSGAVAWAEKLYGRYYDQSDSFNLIDRESGQR